MAYHGTRLPDVDKAEDVLRLLQRDAKRTTGSADVKGLECVLTLVMGNKDVSAEVIHSVGADIYLGPTRTEERQGWSKIDWIVAAPSL